MIKGILLAITLLVLTPLSAFADYEVFDLNPIPSGALISQTTLYDMSGATGNGTRWIVEYLADATVTQFDRVTLPFCRNGGSNLGTVYLEIRSSTTTGPIVASSSLAINGGNIWNCTTPITLVNATTSTFVLNQNVQWVSGVQFYFIWRLISPDPVSNFYWSHLKAAAGGSNGISFGVGTSPTSPTLYTSMQGFALGIPPVVYNASSSNISCSTFDVGCYITQGLSLLFYPEDWTFDQLNELQALLASTTPFGYGYELVDTINTSLAVASSSFELTADLSDFGSVFENATSVPIVSSEKLITFAGDDWDIVQGILAGGFYLLLLSYFWLRFFHTI